MFAIAHLQQQKKDILLNLQANFYVCLLTVKSYGSPNSTSYAIDLNENTFCSGGYEVTINTSNYLMKLHKKSKANL